jgi:cytochrome c peroxidase
MQHGLFLLLLPAFVYAQLAAREPYTRIIPRGLDLYMPVPPDNALTAAKVKLGARLFHDRTLSADGSLSCATCHNATRAFADDRPVAIGVFSRVGQRGAPTLVNRGYGKVFFWDGRAATLEEQVLAPIENPKELGMTRGEVVARLQRDSTYVAAFREAFDAGINERDVAKALASYVRTIYSGDAPFDRFAEGKVDALSVTARAGLALFRGRANCTACHVGPNFSDEKFHNTGVAWDGRAFNDVGRAAITGRSEHQGAFKTPTLREVARTAPYMHDGSILTLEDVIGFYDQGGRANPLLDAELRPLHLSTEEKAALRELLHALSGRIGDGTSH